ncbi:MAG: Rpn family recombination-promoting nuclease/putative transposase [Bacteroidaceae bacterium]|nr:Rpn family recombination-promoting nuclease/putative transposase [Bacteroidaceae bacterium]
MEKKQTVSENETRLLRMAAELGITFIDLKRDFAFKWAFGTPGHEDLLLLLLKGLLPEKHIRKVKLGPQEQQSDREDSQDGIFDILCETDDGSSLSIEMQVCPQADFNDRMVFYSSFPIRNRVGQGVISNEYHSGYNRYKLPPIYTIGILDFELHGVSESERVIRHFSIREDEDEKAQFTDSVHYITVELPKFDKVLSRLSSTQDYILYLIKNIGNMTEIPTEFKGKGLDKLLETCMFANMNETTQMNYVRKMMAERDRAGQLGYAHHQGREEEKEVIARALKAEGVSVDTIAKCTGLTPEQIAML